MRLIEENCAPSTQWNTSRSSGGGTSDACSSGTDLEATLRTQVWHRTSAVRARSQEVRRGVTFPEARADGGARAGGGLGSERSVGADSALGRWNVLETTVVVVAPHCACA